MKFSSANSGTLSNGTAGNGERFRFLCRVRDFSVDRLTGFGLFAVTAMLICYALEKRSPWFILGFAVACALGSAYGFLLGAWPFGLVEFAWSIVALRRWWLTTNSK